MEIENRLKDFILSNYKSIRDFSEKIQMPYSTIDSIFKRGINKASITNIIKICDKLNISADELAKGNLVEKKADISFNDLTSYEKDIIEKFRQLDLRGRQSVLDTIERELTYNNKGSLI